MFAPIVILVRNYLGKAKFNQLRGRALAKRDHGRALKGRN